MITPEERIRRIFMLSRALWDARAEIFDRWVAEIDRENLDWFHRERLDAAVEQQRRVARAYQELDLRDAFEGLAFGVTCTLEERDGVHLLAVGILEGELSSERAFDRLVSEDFPKDALAEEDLDGDTSHTTTE